jgi:hypothetical protein
MAHLRRDVWERSDRDLWRCDTTWKLSGNNYSHDLSWVFDHGGKEWNAHSWLLSREQTETSKRFVESLRVTWTSKKRVHWDTTTYPYS